MKTPLPKKRPSVFAEIISVMLADDHTVVREGLKAILEAEGDIKVIGEADNGRQAVEMARQIRPLIIIMDVAMPQLNGLEATRQILRELPHIRVILLSAHNDDAYVQRAIELGAAGYLSKQTSIAALSKVIREVHRGRVFFSPSDAENLHDANRTLPGRAGDFVRKKTARLSSRQMEILQLVAEGRGNKQIAADLHISPKTVEKHKQQLMEKLNIHDTAGLTRYAISAGIIENSAPIPFE